MVVVAGMPVVHMVVRREVRLEVVMVVFHAPLLCLGWGPVRRVGWVAHAPWRGGTLCCCALWVCPWYSGGVGGGRGRCGCAGRVSGPMSYGCVGVAVVVRWGPAGVGGGHQCRDTAAAVGAGRHGAGVAGGGACPSPGCGVVQCVAAKALVWVPCPASGGRRVGGSSAGPLGLS